MAVQAHSRATLTLAVMAGLVPAIHAFNGGKDVDPRSKSGDDPCEGGVR